MPIKITGVRSVRSKLERMSTELTRDGARIMTEDPDKAWLADELAWLAGRLAKTVGKIISHD